MLRAGNAPLGASESGQQFVSSSPFTATDSKAEIASCDAALSSEHSVTQAANTHRKQTGKPKARSRVVLERAENISVVIG